MFCIYGHRVPSPGSNSLLLHKLKTDIILYCTSTKKLRKYYACFLRMSSGWADIEYGIIHKHIPDEFLSEKFLEIF
ncbi:hypothetical protein BLOT_003360, partial [Blomia tropicalis]